MTVFIIGVDHRIQYTNADAGPEWSQDLAAFENYLVEEGQKKSVDLVAEEFSEELLATNRATRDTAREAGRRLGVHHLFCDPDGQERATHGVSTPEQREEVWLERLQDTNATTALFVCGDDHVETFAQRLLNAGHQAQVLSRGRGKNWRFRK